MADGAASPPPEKEHPHQPCVSIVIPAFNEEKLLPETLVKVREASKVMENAGWLVELIVCDNNSTDRTAQVARDAGARVIFEPVNQIARARNTGASAAIGDWIVFIDADTHPSPGLFESLMRVIESGCCIGGGSVMQHDGDSRLLNWATSMWNGVSRMRHWMAGSFIFCEAGIFRKLKGFNEELYASEEIEFSRRLNIEAKASRKQVVILKDHPLVTSARKMGLYSIREYAMFLFGTMIFAGRNLRHRDKCKIWYDGRR